MMKRGMRILGWIMVLVMILSVPVMAGADTEVITYTQSDYNALPEDVRANLKARAEVGEIVLNIVPDPQPVVEQTQAPAPEPVKTEEPAPEPVKIEEPAPEPVKTEEPALNR